MKPQAIIDALGLEAHPEGGFYKETYRATEKISGHALPDRYGGERALSTAIYYLLTADSFSALHRVQSDEVFHFYLGDPVDLVTIDEKGEIAHTELGPDLALGQRPQARVTRGRWQGLKLKPGGEAALLGATVAPGFDFEDFDLASRDALLKAHPHLKETIRAFTRNA